MADRVEPKWFIQFDYQPDKLAYCAKPPQGVLAGRRKRDKCVLEGRVFEHTGPLTFMDTPFLARRDVGGIFQFESQMRREAVLYISFGGPEEFHYRSARATVALQLRFSAAAQDAFKPEELLSRIGAMTSYVAWGPKPEDISQSQARAMLGGYNRDFVVSLLFGKKGTLPSHIELNIILKGLLDSAKPADQAIGDDLLGLKPDELFLDVQQRARLENLKAQAVFTTIFSDHFSVVFGALEEAQVPERLKPLVKPLQDTAAQLSWLLFFEDWKPNEVQDENSESYFAAEQANLELALNPEMLALASAYSKHTYSDQERGYGNYHEFFASLASLLTDLETRLEGDVDGASLAIPDSIRKQGNLLKRVRALKRQFLKASQLDLSHGLRKLDEGSLTKREAFLQSLEKQWGTTPERREFLNIFLKYTNISEEGTLEVKEAGGLPNFKVVDATAILRDVKRVFEKVWERQKEQVSAAQVAGRSGEDMEALEEQFRQENENFFDALETLNSAFFNARLRHIPHLLVISEGKPTYVHNFHYHAKSRRDAGMIVEWTNAKRKELLGERAETPVPFRPAVTWSLFGSSLAGGVSMGLTGHYRGTRSWEFFSSATTTAGLVGATLGESICYWADWDASWNKGRFFCPTMGGLVAAGITAGILFGLVGLESGGGEGPGQTGSDPNGKNYEHYYGPLRAAQFPIRFSF